MIKTLCFWILHFYIKFACLKEICHTLERALNYYYKNCAFRLTLRGTMWVNATPPPFSNRLFNPRGNFDASTVSVRHSALPWQPYFDLQVKSNLVFFDRMDRVVVSFFFFLLLLSSRGIAELVLFTSHDHFVSIFYWFTFNLFWEQQVKFCIS